MNRREFLLSSAAMIAATALPLPANARHIPAGAMLYTDKPCWFAPDWEYCRTCGKSPSHIGIHGLHCGLQKWDGWRVQVDAGGYMHLGDIDGRYITRADFYE